MALPTQILTLCAAALALGLVLLGVRGAPHPALPKEGEGVCTAPTAEQNAATQWVALAEAHDLFSRPDVLFVDCRPRAEFDQGHIASAVSLPSDSPRIGEGLLGVLSQAQIVIAYCNASGGCASSVRLAARLREEGLSDVRILTGGLPGWLEHGYPAESGPCRLCPAESEP